MARLHGVGIHRKIAELNQTRLRCRGSWLGRWQEASWRLRVLGLNVDGAALFHATTSFPVWRNSVEDASTPLARYFTYDAEEQRLCLVDAQAGEVVCFRLCLKKTKKQLRTKQRCLRMHAADPGAGFQDAGAKPHSMLCWVCIQNIAFRVGAWKS